MVKQKYGEKECAKLAEDFEAWLELPDSLWFKTFWLSKNIDYDFAVELSHKYERLGQAFKKARHWQTANLLEKGLKKELNEGLVKLVLYNTAGWSDKKQISGDAMNPLALVMSDIDGNSKHLVQD